MLAPLPSDSVAWAGKYYRPWFLYWSDILKEVVVQEMTTNEWSQVFSTTEERSASIDATSICEKIVRECTNVSLIILALENVNHETYFPRHSDIYFYTLDILHIPRRNTYHVTTDKRTSRRNQSKSSLWKWQWRLSFGFRRTVDDTKLSATVITSNIGSLNEEVSKDNLSYSSTTARFVSCVSSWFFLFPLLLLHPAPAWWKAQSQLLQDWIIHGQYSSLPLCG